MQYRDVRYAIPFLIQLWLFATPVVYPLSVVSDRWRWLFALNPVTGVIEAFRWALLGSGEFPAPQLALGVVTDAAAAGQRAALLPPHGAHLRRRDLTGVEIPSAFLRFTHLAGCPREAWCRSVLRAGVHRRHLPAGLAARWSVRDAGDPLLNSWILAWDIHALSTNPSQLYDANIFYPFLLPLTYSEVMLSSAMLISPVYLLSGNPVPVHNVLTLGSFWLAGISMYLLVRELTVAPLPSVIAGCVYAFFPYRIGQLSHVQLLLTGWLPLALLFLHRALKTARLRYFVLFAICFTLEALASYYLAYFSAMSSSSFSSSRWCPAACPAAEEGFGLLTSALLIACGVIPSRCLPPGRQSLRIQPHAGTDAGCVGVARRFPYRTGR